MCVFVDLATVAESADHGDGRENPVFLIVPTVLEESFESKFDCDVSCLGDDFVSSHEVLENKLLNVLGLDESKLARSSSCIKLSLEALYLLHAFLVDLLLLNHLVGVDDWSCWIWIPP